MPRAGGSYIYASRGLNPYLGFVASFSQWFGLSIVIGVIAYIIVPFIRDFFISIGLAEQAIIFEIGWVRLSIALLLVWSFVYVNIRGANLYERVLLPMMFLMFALGSIVILAGFFYDSSDFLHAIKEKDGIEFLVTETSDFNWKIFLSAAALLFSSFIGFDSIAQAGSEAKNPTKNLPRAIFLAIFGVACFYFLFTLAVYHTVPWSYVQAKANDTDLTAPGLLSYVLPAGLGAAILLGAAIALINDLPAMLLSVSRLMFAWAEDGIFPSFIAKVHAINHTPYIALIMAGLMASIGILGSHFAGDFFLGIDIMVTSMMVNFLLMCITLLTIPKVNPELYAQVSIIKSRKVQQFIGCSGTLLLIGFLIIHIYKDLSSDVSHWYFRSTPIWLIVMSIASILFVVKWRGMVAADEMVKEKFKQLPEE